MRVDRANVTSLPHDCVKCKHISSHISFSCWVRTNIKLGLFVAQWHDDVIKWKHFPRYWPFVRGIHRSSVNSPHKGQWRGALIFSLICAWINAWVNTREAGDLRGYRALYDITVMDAYALAPWVSRVPTTLVLTMQDTRTPVVIIKVHYGLRYPSD